MLQFHVCVCVCVCVTVCVCVCVCVYIQYDVHKDWQFFHFTKTAKQTVSHTCATAIELIPHFNCCKLLAAELHFNLKSSDHPTPWHLTTGPNTVRTITHHLSGSRS